MAENGRGKKLLLAGVVAVVLVGAAVAILKLRDVDSAATVAAEDIEAQLSDLDPVTRAATLDKLAKDGV